MEANWSLEPPDDRSSIDKGLKTVCWLGSPWKFDNSNFFNVILDSAKSLAFQLFRDNSVMNVDFESSIKVKSLQQN